MPQLIDIHAEDIICLGHLINIFGIRPEMAIIMQENEINISGPLY